MWNYDLTSAERLLEPWRRARVWHAGAFAECSVLRVVLTGRRCEAAAALELVRVAEVLGALGGGNPAREVLRAELLLLRGGLQVLLGARLRAVYNLRQCWCAYRRLECLAPREDAWEAAWEAASPCDPEEAELFSAEDLRGRLCFGLGFFYLSTSLLPVGLCQLARLAGFVTHRRQGKAFLAECAERCLGPRATLAAILLAMYHLDIEPDVCRAGELLVASLGQRPENVLLHWAGSLLAWRNTCIAQAAEMTNKALWCCGEELSGRAIYLRYELGMFHFMAMEWAEALRHLRYVHESVRSERVFFPYRAVVAAQAAAAAFSLGLDEEGEARCRECAAAPTPELGARLESDLAEVLQLFLHRRAEQRGLLAFELAYLLRQLPRLPAATLHEMGVRLERRPELAPGARGDPATAGALVLRAVVLFYLGDVKGAMAFVPELARLCEHLPQWCAYLAAHGLYWCGRVFALGAHREEALGCLRRARLHRRYPFDISKKICKILEELESARE